jgi:hypothetical protein
MRSAAPRLALVPAAVSSSEPVHCPVSPDITEHDAGGRQRTYVVRDDLGTVLFTLTAHKDAIQDDRVRGAMQQMWAAFMLARNREPLTLAR